MHEAYQVRYLKAINSSPRPVIAGVRLRTSASREIVMRNGKPLECGYCGGTVVGKSYQVADEITHKRTDCCWECWSMPRDGVGVLQRH